jgi:hypothetical protein
VESTEALAGVALQTAPLKVCKYTPRGSVFARLVPEHIVKSCGFYRQGKCLFVLALPYGNTLPVNSPKQEIFEQRHK